MPSSSWFSSALPSTYPTKRPDTRSRAANPIACGLAAVASSVSSGNCSSGRRPARSTSGGSGTAAPERAIPQRVAPVGADHVERQHHTDAAHVLDDFAVVPRDRVEPAAGLLARPLHAIEIQLVEDGEQPHHADRIALPRRVELLL